MCTLFNRALRETRQGDILEVEASTATLDTVESLYPNLPSENESEIEQSITKACSSRCRGWSKWSWESKL